MKRAITWRLAVLLALVFSLAGRAGAQGMFYAEEEKDGRIYVFNVKANWERFVASGETGTGLTLLNHGPNGETVFADNEQALDLFNFKHGIKEVVARPKTATQRVEWRDGKTRFTLGDGLYLEMSSRLQPRWTQELPDDSVKLGGTANAGDAKGSFRIRRAKFKLEGWFYRPELEFEVQLNWPDASTTQPSRFLEDANIDWDLSGKKAFRVRFGQFKAPYGRQQITSSGAQQFVDRAITDERYNPGRETGLAVWGTLGDNKIDYRVMVSNGNGRSQSANDNSTYLYSARVMWQALGSARMNQWASGGLLTEGDLGDSGDAPLLGIAGNFLNNDRSNASANVDLKDTQFSGDYVFKYRGFSSIGEYHHRKSTPEAGSPSTTSFKDQGFLLQAAYAFRAPGSGTSYWELAVRYAQLDPNDTKDGDDRSEVGGAVNYYYNKHNLKLQLDWRQLKDDAANSGSGTSNQEVRLQGQLIF